MRGLATHLGTPPLQARAKHSKGTVVVMSTYLTGQGDGRRSHMWQKKGGFWVATTFLVLMIFSFQGHPGPKGEMVRPQLSYLPLKGEGLAWPP